MSEKPFLLLVRLKCWQGYLLLIESFVEYLWRWVTAVIGLMCRLRQPETVKEETNDA